MQAASDISALASIGGHNLSTMDRACIDFAAHMPLGRGRGSMSIPKLSSTGPQGPEAIWIAIHDAAAIVAAIGGILEAEIARLLRPGLTARSAKPIEDAWAQSCQDLSDILQRGIAALIGARANGHVPAGAAAALWDEFLRERDALVQRIGVPDQGDR